MRFAPFCCCTNCMKFIRKYKINKKSIQVGFSFSFQKIDDENKNKKMVQKSLIRFISQLSSGWRWVVREAASLKKCLLIFIVFALCKCVASVGETGWCGVAYIVMYILQHTSQYVGTWYVGKIHVEFQ